MEAQLDRRPPGPRSSGPRGPSCSGTPGADDTQACAVYLRREFALKERAALAMIFVSGLGHYELRLNGEKVGTSVLDPGWTDLPEEGPLRLPRRDGPRPRPERRRRHPRQRPAHPELRLRRAPARPAGSRSSTRAASGEVFFATRAGGRRAAPSRRTASISASATTPASSSTAGTGRASTTAAWDKAVAVAGYPARVADDAARPRDRPSGAESDPDASLRGLRLRLRPELLRLGPAEGRRPDGDRGPAPPRRAPPRGRDPQFRTQRERRGHGRLRPPRRRARGLRAALHLSRLPLRRDDGLPRRARPRRPRRPVRPLRRRTDGRVPLLERAPQPRSTGTSSGASSRTS